MACRLLQPPDGQTLQLWPEPEQQFFPVFRFAAEREGFCQDPLPIDKPFPERSLPDLRHLKNWSLSKPISAEITVDTTKRLQSR